MERLLCPSMMCANFANLEKEVTALEEAGVDIFHLDLMDGNFVPNFGLGLQDIEYIVKKASVPCDIHLMCLDPARYIKKFTDLGVKIIYVHPETDPHLPRTLQLIKDLGAHPGIVVSPGVSFDSVKELLYLADYVLIMTVNPGYAGQKYLDFVTPKFSEFIAKRANYGGYKLMIDGACSPEKVAMLSELGVDGFILGTSAIFGKNRSYKEICQELRKL